MELYFSTSAYGGTSTRQVLTMFWELGIKEVELAIGPRCDRDAVKAITEFQQKGMTYRAHHAFVWGETHKSFNLAEPQEWSYFERMMDWLGDLKVTAYSVHGGDFHRGQEREKAYGQFKENVQNLQQICEKRGIVLGVETMYPTPPNSWNYYLLDNSWELTRFCEELPEMKIVVDLAHVNIWRNQSLSEKLEWLKLPSERILEIHISDNDGKRDIHSPITDSTWWVPYAAQIPRAIPIVIESRLNRFPPSIVKEQYLYTHNLLNHSPSTSLVSR
ncbi:MULTISPECIES: sugar phosphate isomerase/epimerase family protein [Cylindrospermopsis]|jgi:sugar phosphate isomerase/epimerase|uniref:Sugar phosphate isomerase/epimerase n=2 Tax=Cylindrospermopsis TaxID=77021 RepID=A0A7H0F3F8_9CYAN|nr:MULTISPECIES: TIM barrel protein [Cylindrospermopsis]MBU6344429.1 sugar phosphate isomerase/epimerase [Cyanobacteria bacterium REEB494]KRH95740.1 xylose isomerase [Cylindrospermopsis sp. CR12]MCH4904993.1 TIM barrel protein [Cylindrospermopsis raciborskii CHAB3438]MEB3146480.1 TIM barrel protein [Cylindrospermopsis raciborskii]QNP30574.1 sugar phosphate isomerase/epimerase [Cylindrospermopsis curvispora GIHE-G1]